METKTTNKGSARFDARITPEQKMTFLRAAKLGGFRSLSDFVVVTVQEKAKRIIQEHEAVVASQKDSEIFFEAILKAAEPNDNLVAAANRYKELLPE